MKHPSAYYLILIYSIFVCKPFLPVVNDVLAHAFWQTGHLATVHQHEGKNHLHVALKEAAKQDAADATSHGNKTPEPAPVHILTQYLFTFSFNNAIVQTSFKLSCTVATTFLEKHTPPPKV